MENIKGLLAAKIKDDFGDFFDETYDKLSLQSDIYSFTFFKFVTDHNPILIGELMLKCFLTIMVQFSLILFKY